MAEPIHWTEGLSCCNPVWEAAYNRFETPEQERAKFRKRLRSLGCDTWPRSARIADLFCGRGNNLHTLQGLGFTNVIGVDLSPDLLRQYDGEFPVYVGDCRELKLPDASLDIVIVQGGLHHLPRIPQDLSLCVAEMHRVLVPGGMAVFVEPWLTPFLRFVHLCGRQAALRRLYPRLDALMTMVDEEQETYFAWLDRPDEVHETVDQYFETVIGSHRWGKWSFVGRRRD